MFSSSPQVKQIATCKGAVQVSDPSKGKYTGVASNPTALLMDHLPYGNDSPNTWLIVGASRGIGCEFVRQLLDCGDHVVATIRRTLVEKASSV